jgi:hypothetical protein
MRKAPVELPQAENTQVGYDEEGAVLDIDKPSCRR